MAKEESLKENPEARAEVDAKGAAADVANVLSSFQAQTRKMLDDITSQVDKLQGRITDIKGASFQSEVQKLDVGADEAASRGVLHASALELGAAGQTMLQMQVMGWQGVVAAGSLLNQIVASSATNCRVVHGHASPPAEGK